MISLKNETVTKLIDRLYTILSEIPYLPSSEIINQISYLLVIKRENEFWRRVISESRSGGAKHYMNNIITNYIIEHTVLVSNPVPQIIINELDFRLTDNDLIAECVELIDQIYNEARSRKDRKISDYDINGLIFDELLEKQIKQSGSHSENMYLPNHICKLMVRLATPGTADKIYDPMCGSGGLLLNAYEQSLINNNKAIPLVTDEDSFQSLAYTPSHFSGKSPQLTGIDSNLDQLLLAYLNFELRGITGINLQPNEYLKAEVPQNINLILANPPFGKRLDNGDEAYYKDGFTTRYKDLAFIHKIYSSLSEGGRAAIIVSEGFLSNSNPQYRQCREILLTCAEVEAIISLPAGIFPNTPAKSSLLMLNKKEFDTENVWFYQLQSDGYTADKLRRRTKDTPLPDAVKAYQNRWDDMQNERSKESFFVSFEDIKANDYNLTYNRYKQFSYDTQEYQNSGEIMERIQDFEKVIQKELEELSNLIYGINNI